MVNKNLLILLLSLESCSINMVPKETEKNISENEGPSSTVENDEQNIPNDLSNIIESFDPNKDLTPYGFYKLESDPNNPDSVYNNIIGSQTPLYELIKTKYKFQGQGFYSEYSTNKELRNALLSDLIPSLNTLLLSIEISSNNELNKSLTDYIIASLSDNNGYDLSNNGFVYLSKDHNNKYLIIDGFYLDQDNYKVDFIIETPKTYDLIKLTLDQRESDAFGQ